MHHGDLIKNISKNYNINIKNELLQEETWGGTIKIHLILSNGGKLFFKEKASNISEEETNFRQCIQNIITKKYSNLPKLIENVDGNYGSSHRGLKYELQEFIDTTVNHDIHDYNNIGELIGNLHNALHSINSKFRPQNAKKYYPISLEEFCDNTVKFIDLELKKKGMYFYQFFPKKEIQKIWEHIDQRIIEKQLIHGDFHKNNIIFSTESKIIDLDDLRYDMKLRDLSWYLGIESFIEYNQKGYLGVLKNNFSQEIFDKFIKGYNRTVNLVPCCQEDIFLLLTIDIFAIFVNCTGLDDFKYDGNIIEDMVLLKGIFNFLCQKGNIK